MTFQNPYDRIKNPRKLPTLFTFIYRASWDATGKTIKIRASDEDKARVKAEGRKDIKGALRLTYMGYY